MEINKKSNKLFELFNFNRGNRPDAVTEDTSPTIKRYFKLLGRRFWQLFGLNMMMLLTVLPLLLIVYLYFGIKTTPTENTELFSPLYGANLIHSSPASTSLLDLFGAQMNIPVYNVWSYVGIVACVLFLAVTFGWQNVGASYVLRGMVRGEPVFLFSDYFYAVKRNLKQGFLFGLLDIAVIFLLVYDFIYFSGQTGNFASDLGFYAVCALAVLYFFMRFYVYLLMITFNLSIRKILKNAVIFAVLGWKRNFMGLLGILLMTAINVLLFTLMQFNVAIALILPFVYYLSFTAFTSAYAAYPIIDRYMIAPFQSNSVDENGEEEADAADAE